MKRRLLAIAMTLAMALSLLPVTALAVEEPEQDTVAIVQTADGQKTEYPTLHKAMQAATAGSTVVLQKDVNVTSTSSTKNFGVTVDLNGYNINGEALAANKPALELKTNYGSEPVEGVDSTICLINSKAPDGGTVTAKLPVRFKAGDSNKPVSGVIGDGVNLVVLDGGVTAVELESSAYLLYSETTAKYISNGGFRVSADGQDRIYGTYANATKVAAGRTITMLNDYTGSAPINSGNATSTLDLNDKTYTYTGTERIAEINNDNVGLTLMNGTLKCKQSNVDGIHMLYSNTSLTLDNVTLDASGSYGIVTNGQETGNSITLKHSALTAENGSGIYFPSTGNVTIENSKVSAENVGVQMCAGSLAVKGEKTTITATGTPQTKTENDGVIPDAAAVSIVEREGYQDLGAVAIEAGTFEAAESSKAVKAYAFNNANKTEDEWAGASEVITITGGTFSSDVSDYIPENYIQDEDGTVAQLGADNAVAQVGDSYYATLSEAFSKASSGDTVKVLSNTDISGSKVVVSANKSLTLDLNGKEVKAVNNGNIFVSGKLTIRDTSDGAQGTIRATQEYGGSYTGGIVVASGEDALLTMESGNIVASGFEDPKNNGQFGVMVQGGGDFTMTGGKIEAGWYAAAGNGKDKTTNSVINIQGGELISTADYALYLPQSGNTTISGGTIRGAAGGISIQRGTLTIDNDNALITSLGTGDTGDWGDGTGGQDPAALNIAAEYGNTSVTISAGKFIAEQKDLFIKAPTKYTVSLAITGGYYSNDPSEFLTTVGEKNYVAVESGLDGYNYMVVEANAAAAEVVPAAPEVTTPANLGEEDEAVADAVAEAMKGEDAPALVAGDGLDAAAATRANENEVTVEAGTAALGDAGIITGGKTVTIVVQPYMSVEITAVNKTAGTITLDITPMYRTVATTANLNAPTPEAIKVSGDAGVGNDANAVEIPGAGGELTITKEVTITIPLGGSGLYAISDTVYVKHSKDGSLVGYHKATIGGSEGAYTLTFTNDKGFSTFEAAKDDRTATVSFNGKTEIYTPENVNDTLPDVTAPSGQRFGGWQFDGISGTYTTLTDDLLTALAEKGGTITAKAYFYTPSQGGSGSSGATRYTVSVPDDIEGGSIKVSPTRASRGQTVTITVDPDEGYVLDRLIVRDSDGDRIDLERKSATKYTFEMPRGKVTVEATFVEGEEESVLPFRDVDVDDWSYNAVVYVTDAGIMSGVSETEFAPNATLTRAMIAQMLWALEDKPVVNYLMTYDDVAAGAWYGEAVRWISSQGFMSGYSDAAFGPNDPLTREQLCLILYNYAEWAGYDVSGGVSLGSYLDAGDASAWAVEALEWALDAGLISGRGENLLVPAGTATRAEIAQIMMNFLEKVAR